MERFCRQPDASARSLLVTVFGDSVLPHGGEIWIGSLFRLVEPLGVSERLVRTSLHRLVGDGLLVTRRLGRRSFYSVAPAARASFAEADVRIYHPRGGDAWDGRWTVVVETNGAGPSARAAMRQQLAWLGFASLGSPVHISPLDRTDELRRLLADLGLGGHVAVFRGAVPAELGLGDRDLAGVISAGLGELEPAWSAFLATFGPLAEAAGAGGGASAADAVEPETAFVARTLLVHAYRRVVLREPDLPAELWPPGWIGDAAYAVAVRCYQALTPAAEIHLMATGVAADGALPPFDAGYAGRYNLIRD